MKITFFATEIRLKLKFLSGKITEIEINLFMKLKYH